MRKIDFRAWDKVNQKMICSPMAICFEAWVLFTAEVEGMDCNKAIHPIQQYEIMQFTGLVDKHGKDIYEGDILLIGPSEEQRFYPNVVVRWKFNRWVFGTSEDWDFKEWYFDGGNVEVIGNMYETPELLQKAGD